MHLKCVSNEPSQKMWLYNVPAFPPCLCWKLMFFQTSNIATPRPARLSRVWWLFRPSRGSRRTARTSLRCHSAARMPRDSWPETLSLKTSCQLVMRGDLMLLNRLIDFGAAHLQLQDIKNLFLCLNFGDSPKGVKFGGVISNMSTVIPAVWQKIIPSLQSTVILDAMWSNRHSCASPKGRFPAH